MRERDGFEVLFEAMATGDTGRAIENQEKRGQGDLNASDVIPLERRGITDELLTTLGFRLGDVVDELFQSAILPTGWKKVATDHSMWTYIVDDKGRQRGAIFYKAAFYDRSAHMNLDRRFYIKTQPVGGYSDGYDRNTCETLIIDGGMITDGSKVIWISAPATLPEKDWQKRDKIEESQRQEAETWLMQKYPDYLNLTAYWDVD